MRPTTPTWAVLAAAGALLAGCGGSGHVKPRGKQCRALIAFAGPTNTPLGREQLGFAQLALAHDNASNDTEIALQVSDTGSSPSRAAAIGDQLVTRSGVLAVIGPATDREVDAVGPTFARAGIAFISASATGSGLTAGANPTFFRVVPPDSLQGPELAQFIVAHLHPKAVLMIDDVSGYGRRLAASMVPVFRASRVVVQRASVNPRAAGAPASVVGRVTPGVGVVVLDWSVPRAAQRLGQTLVQQRKTVTLVGPDRLFAPGEFSVAGAYVASPGPDITQLPGDASVVLRIRRALPRFGIPGPLAYAATHVVDEAVAAVCRAGHAPSASDVLAAVRATHEARSILGVPIRFGAGGELADPRWFLFRIDSAGRYRLIP